jgi:hypothetical protein
MNIIYRTATANDVDSPVQFWNTNAGWDVITRETWEKRFLSTPFGQPMIVLGVDSDKDEIIAQFIFVPVMVRIDLDIVKAYRPFGSVMKEDVRKKFGVTSFLMNTHPIQKMYYKAVEELKGNGAKMMFLIPDPRWGKILKLMPFQVTQFPLWSHKLPLQKEFVIPENIEVEEVSADNAQIDSLWMSTSTTHTCSIVRNSKTYAWKLGLGKFKLFGVFRRGQLIGLFTLLYKSDGYQWIIGDLLLTDDQTNDIIIKAACNAANNEYKKDHSNEISYKTSVLATPAVEKIVKANGFQKDNYQFTFAVQLLDQSPQMKKAKPEKWYVSAND